MKALSDHTLVAFAYQTSATDVPGFGTPKVLSRIRMFTASLALN